AAVVEVGGAVDRQGRRAEQVEARVDVQAQRRRADRQGEIAVEVEAGDADLAAEVQRGGVGRQRRVVEGRALEVDEAVGAGGVDAQVRFDAAVHFQLRDGEVRLDADVADHAGAADVQAAGDLAVEQALGTGQGDGSAGVDVELEGARGHGDAEV